MDDRERTAAQTSEERTAEVVEEPAKADFSKMNKSELKEVCEGLTEENEALKKAAEDAKAEAEQSKKVALQAAEFQTLYTRLKGDFDNYRRRNAEINEKAKEDAAVSLAEKLLPVLDNFGRAISSIHDENILVGVQMIFGQLSDVLGNMNVKMYESLGKEFDHNLHDAVLMQDAEPDKVGKVINVIQEGYMYGDRVVRAAKVIVGKAPEEEA